MSDNISFEDFTKVDIRVGTIIKVEDFPKAKKLAFQLLVDFGDLGIKRSSAQITDIYTKDALLNRQVTAIVNFKPKQIANFISECLILGVANDDGNIVLLKTSSKIINGTQVN